MLVVALAGLGIGRSSAGATGGARGTQGYLGVDIHDVSDEELASLKLKESRGAEIVRVDHDGPAGKAGLREHDVVLGMNGQPVEGEEQLRRMLREMPAGRTVMLTISRDGQTQTLTAQMANREEVERQAWERHMPVPEPEAASPVPGDAAAVGERGGRAEAGLRGMGFFHGSATSTMLMGHGERGLLAGASNTGAMLEALSPQLAEFFGAPNGTGLLVRSVTANSPAAVGGLRAGDVVVKVNQTAVVSGTDWTRMTRESKGRPVAVMVVREKHAQTLTITPDGKHRSRLEFPRCGPDSFAGVNSVEPTTVVAAVRPGTGDLGWTVLRVLGGQAGGRAEDLHMTEVDRLL